MRLAGLFDITFAYLDIATLKGAGFVRGAVIGSAKRAARSSDELAALLRKSGYSDPDRLARIIRNDMALATEAEQRSAYELMLAERSKAGLTVPDSYKPKRKTSDVVKENIDEFESKKKKAPLSRRPSYKDYESIVGRLDDPAERAAEIRIWDDTPDDLKVRVIDALVEAKASKVGFDAEQNALAARFNSRHKPGPVKRIESIRSKLRRKKSLENEPQRISDLVRSTQVFHNFVDMRVFFSSLKKKGKVVGTPDNRFLKPRPSGYRDIIMTYRATDGSTGELQLHISEMLFVKDSRFGRNQLTTHDLYKLGADLEEAADSVGAKQIRAIEQAIHDEAWKHFRERTGSRAIEPFSADFIGSSQTRDLDAAKLRQRIEKRIEALPWPRRR